MEATAGGPSFFAVKAPLSSFELSASPGDAVRAYAVATVVFELPALWERMRDASIPTAVSDAIILESRRLLDRASRWLLTNRPQPLAVGSAVARFSEPVRAVAFQSTCRAESSGRYSRMRYKS